MTNLETKTSYNRDYYLRNKEKMIKTIRGCFLKNKEKYRAQQRKRYELNKERLIEESKDYYEENKHKNKIKRDTYRKQNKERLYQTQRLRYKNDINYKLSQNLRNRIKNAIIKNKDLSDIKARELLGCTLEEVRIYIESRFTEGMSWTNYGLKGWHIDHIKPINTFDLSDSEQRKQCFHYTNLRPLWAKDNLKRPHNGSDLV
jgi:hypothetical protein